MYHFKYYAWHVVKVAIGAKIALITIFVMCVKLPLSTHMCRVSKHGNSTARSPVCIYCGETNHRSAYCRYRLKDNHEEPKNTPDALKTGTAGENLASAARTHTRFAPHNNNNVPFSHSDGRAQGQPNRGQVGSQSRGQYNRN